MNCIKKRKLNSERFQFIIDNCKTYLNISSFFVKELINKNDNNLLEILFKNYLKFLIICSLLIYLIITKIKYQYQTLIYITN